MYELYDLDQWLALFGCGRCLQAERMELPVHLLNALGFAHFHLSEVAQVPWAYVELDFD